MMKQTPAEMRAEAAEPLRELGARRLELMAQLSEIDAELRPLVAHAVHMEVPYRSIRDMTGVSTNTARAWAQKQAD